MFVFFKPQTHFALSTHIRGKKVRLLQFELQNCSSSKQESCCTKNANWLFLMQNVEGKHFGF